MVAGPHESRRPGGRTSDATVTPTHPAGTQADIGSLGSGLASCGKRCTRVTVYTNLLCTAPPDHREAAGASAEHRGGGGPGGARRHVCSLAALRAQSTEGSFVFEASLDERGDGGVDLLELLGVEAVNAAALLVEDEDAWLGLGLGLGLAINPNPNPNPNPDKP